MKTGGLWHSSATEQRQRVFAGTTPVRGALSGALSSVHLNHHHPSGSPQSSQFPGASVSADSEPVSILSKPVKVDRPQRNPLSDVERTKDTSSLSAGKQASTLKAKHPDPWWPKDPQLAHGNKRGFFPIELRKTRTFPFFTAAALSAQIKKEGNPLFRHLKPFFPLTPLHIWTKAHTRGIERAA